MRGKMLVVESDGERHWLRLGGRRWRCAIGKGGVCAEKREGDGATPQGRWLLRALFYRPDRLAPPASGFSPQALAPEDGWCDDPSHPDYNRRVGLPFAASHERLWRDDGLYDLILPLGYNDDPPEAGKGSAIFLHVARDDYAPTEGCVALRRDHLLALLPLLAQGDSMLVLPPSP